MVETMRRACRALSQVDGRWVGLVSCAALAWGIGGCTLHPVGEHGWGHAHKLQVLFYSPPGSTVTFKSKWGGRRVQDITTDETLDHRLQTSPEEYAVYQFYAGRYKFQYTTAPGFPGVTIYGELDVHANCDAEFHKFVRNTFIPIKLPSRYYLDARSLHPVEGPSAAGLNETEVDQLAQGDMIEKVYFIADLDSVSKDLDRIDKRLEKLRSAETVLNSSMDYWDARHEDYRRDSVYASPTTDIDDATKEFWGADRKFNEIEAKRQRLENQRYELHAQAEKLTQERRIRRTLLDSMRIINRSGAVVLATPEYQWPFHDTFDQVANDRHYKGFTVGPGNNYHLGDFELNPIGRVVAVMRVGGRHKHWSGLPTEMAANADSADDFDTLEVREQTRTHKSGPVVE